MVEEENCSSGRVDRAEGVAGSKSPIVVSSETLSLDEQVVAVSLLYASVVLYIALAHVPFPASLVSCLHNFYIATELYRWYILL